MTFYKRIITILTILIAAGSIFAMPPSPETYEYLKQNDRLGELDEMYQMWRNKGINQPFDAGRVQINRDDGDREELRVVVLLADFDDQVADTSYYDVEHYEQMLFSEDEYQSGSMRDWYLENSYGEVDIVGDVFGWYRLPEDYEYYVDGQSGFGQYPQNAQGMVYDLMQLANDDVDFSDYDNDGDGVVEGLFVVHAGAGAEANNRNEDMIWSHAWGVQPNGLTMDGTRFNRYAMEPENGEIGVFGHELGHSMFGLPDLYDTSYESAGIGRWSMMAGGSWGGGGTRPVHFDAWCKMHIGFTNPFPIIMDMDSIILSPSFSDDDVLITWRDGEWDREYFLIENRQLQGFDASAPAAGLLIWHIDDNMNDNSNTWYPGNEGNRHFRVALEQADGDYDLEMDNNSGDYGDPWPGSTHNRYFGSESEPNSQDYESEETFVQVFNIEHYDTTLMIFDIVLDELPPLEELSLYFCSKIPDAQRYPHPDDPNDERRYSENLLIRQLLWEAGANIAAEGDSIPEDLDEFNTVIYAESWREDDVETGLTWQEQMSLAGFLEGGGNLILIGPDVATNMLSVEGGSILWQYMHGDYIGEGSPADSQQVTLLRNLTVDEEFSGMTFPYITDSPCADYLDIIEPDSTATLLFQDQNGNPHGLYAKDPVGYRIIIQPFMFGGLKDRGSTKQRLMSQYFEYFRYVLDPRGVELTDPAQPSSHNLMVAYPNPFNSMTKISYPLSPNLKGIDIYDMQGRAVGRLDLEAGANIVEWRPTGLASGSYLLMPNGSSGVAPLRVSFVK